MMFSRPSTLVRLVSVAALIGASVMVIAPSASASTNYGAQINNDITNMANQITTIQAEKAPIGTNKNNEQNELTDIATAVKALLAAGDSAKSINASSLITKPESIALSYATLAAGELASATSAWNTMVSDQKAIVAILDNDQPALVAEANSPAASVA